jgi:hypothetical protein
MGVEKLANSSLTGKQWDPCGVELGPGGGSREMAEMKTIRSLDSGIPKRQLAALRRQQDSVEHWGQVEMELSKISPTLEPRTFCNRLIEAVNVASLYRDDIDDAIERRKVSSITTDRHSKIGRKEMVYKWNVGLETAKNTIQVTTQNGVRTSVHPMLRRVRVDHLHLH